ncbi:hypothetical protein F2Q70_00022040 [Brassica cretica]|uniref:Uncharacterized protein n=1 Tax=Brassica cretica TaxID=69181 RepID=A0A8S9GSA1_BRACR|nr:hypothetical protein F2Q70_00022040 [Brassica cretica]
MIDQYFDVSPLQGEELEVEETMDEVNGDELADFLTEGTREMKNLTTSSLSPCKVALLVLAAYNWVPSSNKNAVSIDRAKIVYKMFHGVSVDIGVMVYNQVLNFGVIQKEGEKKDTRRILVWENNISRIERKHEKLKRKLRGRLRRKGNLHQHQLQHLLLDHHQALLDLIGLLLLDAEEAKLALDTTSKAIQQLATAMQTLTSVVGQIASMMFPRGEEEIDDPQQQDDQGN